MGSLVQILARLSFELGRMEESAKEQFNFNELTLTQMNYLETINHLQNPNLTELALEMKMTKPTVKSAVDKLIEKDFISRVKSDNDRRSVHFHLTKKGDAINSMHDYAHRQMAQLVNSRLTSDEVEHLAVILDKVF